ncbi:MAG: hypothetical protein DME32_18260 [Verrucomicrobia bacterium]|nr:MAG: hypothetical protein DME32_18260 [Verrucomicrobiota bacterium]
MMDTILILYADHEFNASTFAARVTASTLADIYAAVTSACATLKGPLHGGANEQSMRMLDEIKTPGATRVCRSCARSDAIWGNARERKIGSRFARSWSKRWNARNISAPMSISTPRRSSPCWDSIRP